MTGLYDIIGIPFGYLMRVIYAIFKNYAVSIIVFTIVTRIILLPASYSMQKNMARTQLIQPKLEKIRKSFSSNPQRMQEEQQKLYHEEGINQASSCLPSLIQMILLFGVLDVVYKPLTHILGYGRSLIDAAAKIAEIDTRKSGLRIELKIMEAIAGDKSKFASLSDSFADKVFDFNNQFTILGANLGKTPTLHPEVWNKEALVLAAIPFIAGISQLLVSFYTQMRQKKMNPTASQQPGGGCMNVMMYGMPLFSIWMAFTFPAGLGFYWIWSSIMTFLVNFALNQYFTPERAAAINEKEKQKAKEYAAKHPGKKSFMQRLMEQQAEMENQQKGNYTADGVKLSKSEKNKYDREKLNEARKRMAEKYGDQYDDNDDEE